MLQLTEFSRSQLEDIYSQHVAHGFFQKHKEQIHAELLELGAVPYDLWLPETHALPLIIHPNEHITGIVYGRYHQEDGHQVGRGALVATNTRILLIDKKPLFIRCDEVTYEVVSGVTYTTLGFVGTVTLHTRIGAISVRTFNQKCAESFVESVEATIFSNAARGKQYDYSP